MSTVASLSKQQLQRRLAHGLHLRTGNFTVRLQSAIPAVAHGIGLMYADYPLAAASDFADFHLHLLRPKSHRRWIRPQVKLLYNGRALFKPLPLDQAFPMFEWGLNWCVASRAHSYLIIHAAVIEKHGYSAILPAPPGSGKSTLCAALVGRGGWRLLSDELTLLRLADGRIIPLPRPVSLKNDAIAVIRDYLPGAIFSPAVTDTSKGTVAHMRPPGLSVSQAGQSAAPGWVVFPRYRAASDTALQPIAPAYAFMQLAENSFNYSVLGVQGFNALAALADQCPAYQLEYSRLDEALACFDVLAKGR
jgi:HprK-related kinase A